LIEARDDKEKGAIVYQITFEFLKHLGLGSVVELPEFEKLNRNNNLEKLLQGLVSGTAEQEIKEEIKDSLF